MTGKRLEVGLSIRAKEEVRRVEKTYSSASLAKLRSPLADSNAQTWIYSNLVALDRAYRFAVYSLAEAQK